MQPNELRIGNLVDIINRTNEIHFPTGVTFKIIAIGLFKVQCILNELLIIKATDKDILTVPLADLSPITLNEDWLLKFRFGKIEGSDDLFQKKWLRVKKCFDESKGYESPFYSGNHQSIKYVHQLQNLYFAITDEELSIEPAGS